MYSYNPYYEEYISHHGIKGQRWGIRRYQPYPSGSRVKGGKEVGKAKARSNRDIVAKADRKEVLKNYERLSTQELREARERINLVSEINTKSPEWAKKVSKTADILKAAAAITTSAVLINKNAPQIMNTGKTIINSIINNTPKGPIGAALKVVT